MGGIVGPMTRSGQPEADDAMVVSFLERALAWERGPQHSHRHWLERQGMFFAAPGTLQGEALATELGRLIDALVLARVFFEHTDHLSDAELYRRLWEEVLEETCPDAARTPDDMCHWDFAAAGTSGEQDWLIYYADEDERAEWAEAFPDEVLPPHRDPPYRRDERLPGDDRR